MKRISITKGFLAILIVCALLLGAAAAYVLINPNLIGSLADSNTVAVSSEEYTSLVNMYNKYEKTEEIWQEISSEFYKEADPEQLETYMIKGLVAGLGDIYSCYYTQEEYEEINLSLTGEYSGVGITMTQGEDYITVLKVSHDSPAAKGGVTVGEKIIAVDGISYSSSEMDSAAASIRGEAGTSVTITFLKDGELIDRTFIRAHITTDTVESKMLDDNIGYIWLYSFENGTVSDFKSALTSLGNADALVLDLRSNPGGLVDAAHKIADMFMDNGTLFYTEDHDGNREYYKTENGKLWDKPFVILIDENSASASEILAGGLQANNMARVVGVQSFGKGIIQSLAQFDDGSALKLTMWQYFTPEGEAIHQVGITPDYVVELTDDCYDEYGNLVNDLQLEKAVQLMKDRLK